MRLPLAKYGLKEIVLSTLVFLLLSAILVYFKQYYFVVLPVLFLGFVFYFFRDPHRVIPQGDDLVVSPADGKIIEIADQKENEFLNTECVKIAIFLSVFNVHVNRAPLSGQVRKVVYRKGKFHVASDPEASTQNESNALLINNNLTSVLIRQVSGILARRIVCVSNEGDELKKGDRFGMIKFGSRTELFIPKRNVASVSIKMGQMVKGGETVLGKLAN